MSESRLTSVNEHCLDNVMKLAQTTKVTTSEDVYDAHGTKLVAKGADITPAMKEKLVHHKLRKPLETSLSVVDGMTAANDLGLTTAVPARIEVLADARLKPIKLGNQEIRFKSAAPSRLYWANRPAMRVVQALHWMQDACPGQRASTYPDHVATIARRS